MKGKIAYPDWVEKYRGPGLEIKKKGNSYYLSERKTVYDKNTKKPKKISGKYLGKITPDGLQPPKEKSQKIDAKPPLEYGATHLLDIYGKDILTNLIEVFGKEEANEIFALGKQALIEPSPLKRKALIYSSSYDSITYPRLSLSAASLTKFLHDLGGQRQEQVEFMKKYLTGSEYLIFDGTRLVSYSDNNALAEIGYNHCGLTDPQANLLYCFSLKPTQAPVYFRVNAGDKTDYDTILNAITETEINNVIMIADKGFGSEKNFAFFKEHNLSYIIPLRRNDNEIDYSVIDMANFSSFDGFFDYQERTIFYKVLSKTGIKEIIVKEKKRGRKPKIEIEAQEQNYKIVNKEFDLMVLYYDDVLRSTELRDYTTRMRQNYKGYTLEGLSEKQKSFGTVVLTSNVDFDAAELYSTYKERELIEDGNKAYKNVLGIGASSLQNDISYRGWLFINHIGLMLYYRILNKLKEAKKLKELSVSDVIALTKRITKQQINNTWITETGTKIELEKIFNIFPEYNTQD